MDLNKLVRNGDFQGKLAVAVAILRAEEDIIEVIDRNPALSRAIAFMGVKKSRRSGRLEIERTPENLHAVRCYIRRLLCRLPDPGLTSGLPSQDISYLQLGI